MDAYIIENKVGELILWTVSYDRARAIKGFTDFVKQDWDQLEQEGYLVRKVQIKRVVE